MTSIRQMTQKGDPILRTQLPANLLTLLQVSAKQNKRRIQDEFIKRLAATLNREISLATMIQKSQKELQDAQTPLHKYAQMISCEMMEALQQSAEDKNISLEIEINARLMASFEEPQACGISSNLDAILNFDFNHQQAIAECKNSRQSWLYLYEMEKLKLYLLFSKKLPRNLKEKFILIEVETATKQIRAELEAEKKSSEEN